MTKFGLAAVVALCVLGLDLGPAQSQQLELRYNRWLPPKHPIDDEIFKNWFDEIAKVTNGRVKISFTTSSLGPLPRQYELVTSGAVDVSFGTDSLMPGRFPLAEIVEIPFLGQSGEANSVAYWRVYKAHFDKVDPYAPAKVLSLNALSPYQIYNNVRPVQRIADLNGLKLRVTGSQAVDAVRGLGAVAVAAPATQLYDLISKGVVDGTIYTGEGLRTFNVTKMIKHQTTIKGGLSSSSAFVVINKAKWDQISKADQEAIESVSGEKIARQLGRFFDNGGKIAENEMRENGAQIIEANPQFLGELKEKLKFVEDSWIKKAREKGVDGEAAVKMLREEAAAYKAP